MASQSLGRTSIGEVCNCRHKRRVDGWHHNRSVALRSAKCVTVVASFGGRPKTNQEASGDPRRAQGGPRELQMLTLRPRKGRKRVCSRIFGTWLLKIQAEVKSERGVNIHCLPAVELFDWIPLDLPGSSWIFLWVFLDSSGFPMDFLQFLLVLTARFARELAALACAGQRFRQPHLPPLGLFGQPGDAPFGTPCFCLVP